MTQTEEVLSPEITVDRVTFKFEKVRGGYHFCINDGGFFLFRQLAKPLAKMLGLELPTKIRKEQ